MTNYKMEIYSDIAEDGVQYWTVKFPAVPGCIGGGDTPEEAIAEAQENLEDYLDYLESEGYPLPESDLLTQEYSGKIALRTSKRTHREIAKQAKEDGVSINSLICNAIERYLGHQNYDDKLDEKIEQIRTISIGSFALQQINANINQKLWSQYTGETISISEEE